MLNGGTESGTGRADLIVLSSIVEGPLKRCMQPHAYSHSVVQTLAIPENSYQDGCPNPVVVLRLPLLEYCTAFYPCRISVVLTYQD